MERPLRGEGEGVNTYYLKPTTITTKGKSTFCNEGNNCIIYNIVLVGRAAEGGGGVYTADLSGRTVSFLFCVFPYENRPNLSDPGQYNLHEYIHDMEISILYSCRFILAFMNI